MGIALLKHLSSFSASLLLCIKGWKGGGGVLVLVQAVMTTLVEPVPLV